MTLPDIVQQFFNLPSEDKLDEYLQQDVSADTSQSFGSSPRLTTSDNRLLDPAFWINHPTQLNTIRRLICNSEEVPQPAAKDDWLDELLVEPFVESDVIPVPLNQSSTPRPDRVHTQTSSSITEPESDVIPVLLNQPSTLQPDRVRTQTSSSITEPESDVIPVLLNQPSILQPDRVRTQTSSSITEPESDVIPVPLNQPSILQPDRVRTQTSSSITEPESDVIPVPLNQPSTLQPNRVRTQTSSSITEPKSDVIPVPLNQPSTLQPNRVRTQTSSSITEPESKSDELPSNPFNQPVLNRNSFFATPSPPPPGSLYWNYFTREEEAKFYDRSRTNEAFREIRQKKYELEVSLGK
ncbi:hypothetical protein EV424DRAFT_1545488 [Suillus variegatus]|nr:hypothetical protein EV424DRAFT_1545488 [Suillus variegatus]